ncbi:MAG TPA: circadian clock KaiB family protein [Methylomirabilota bacterium]|nr:circadian clock KaiB family protein [Methylomirabilota bacterium]
MEAKSPGDGVAYHFRLYIFADHPKCRTAYASLKSICEDYLHGRYNLEVIDLHRCPEKAADDQIIAIPTLVRVKPGPVRRLIGDLADQEKVIASLELHDAAR